MYNESLKPRAVFKLIETNMETKLIKTQGSSQSNNMKAPGTDGTKSPPLRKEQLQINNITQETGKETEKKKNIQIPKEYKKKNTKL